MDFWSSKKGKMLEISILGILTIFGIGSQYFSNLAYSLNQGILQTSFGIGSQYLIIPSVIANFAFALGVPLGHTLTHKFGFRRNFFILCNSIFNRLDYRAFFFRPNYFIYC